MRNARRRCWPRRFKREFCRGYSEKQVVKAVRGNGWFAIGVESRSKMVETRKAAAYTVYHLFRHFLEQREREMKTILRHGEGKSLAASA